VTNGSGVNSPSVFISYSHDSADHKDWVRRLAGDLRKNGVDVTLDQWDLAPGQHLVAFMEKGIYDSDHVICVCSDGYVRKADDGVGGVAYERMAAAAEIAKSTDTSKFIPLLRANTSKSPLPRFLGHRLYIDFNDDAKYEERREQLLRDLLGAPANPKPPLGTNPFSNSMPKREEPEGKSSGSIVVVRSFPPAGQMGEGEVLIDLTDLFVCRPPNRPEPKHPEIWVRDLPVRLATAVETIAALPRPVELAPNTHLSIAWYLGTLLNPKGGIPISRLRQRSPNAQDEWWDVATAQAPEVGKGWVVEQVALGDGQDLALVVSATKNALIDAQRAIATLPLSVGAIHHARLAHSSQTSIQDGGHARWLANGLIENMLAVVAQRRPKRLHLFPACPVGLAFLLGQQADALGPTTVYEFLYGDSSRDYKPGMATGPQAGEAFC
jgi:hypothetical protein